MCSFVNSCDPTIFELGVVFRHAPRRTGVSWQAYSSVSKKVNNCIHRHTSGKQYRILTKLHQQWNIELQTKYQISIKSVDVCKSYSMFSDVTPKHAVSIIDNV